MKKKIEKLFFLHRVQKKLSIFFQQRWRHHTHIYLSNSILQNFIGHFINNCCYCNTILLHFSLCKKWMNDFKARILRQCNTIAMGAPSSGAEAISHSYTNGHSNLSVLAGTDQNADLFLVLVSPYLLSDLAKL